MSWDEALAADYEEWSAHMTEDVAFYVGLAGEAAGPVVELAVGNGRVAIPVAQATGQRVIGLDSSPAMLDQARARADTQGVELDLREADMRDLRLDEPAGLIYCPARALLHLATWADRRRTFERVAASLRPGGRFAWNAFAFDHRLAVRIDGVHQDEPGPHTIRYSVGDEERMARTARRRRPRTGSAVRGGSQANRSPRTARSTCSSPAVHSSREGRGRRAKSAVVTWLVCVHARCAGLRASAPIVDRGWRPRRPLWTWTMATLPNSQSCCDSASSPPPIPEAARRR